MGPLFWHVLTIACVVWYSTITFYVAVKGLFDITGMLERLKETTADDAADAAEG